jgi:hypothetical protein
LAAPRTVSRRERSKATGSTALTIASAAPRDSSMAGFSASVVAAMALLLSAAVR